MQKIMKFLRSMTFGVILLGLITLCSLAGSLITQNAEPMTYVKYYPDTYQILFALQLDHIFTSWYFILLCALLCINLTFCSVTRITGIIKNKPKAYDAALHLKKQAVSADPEELQEVKACLEQMRCRKKELDGVTVYTKNEAGWYGTFLTHLGLLLTILLFGAAMYLPKVTDEPCMPGESLTMEDGTKIAVQSFRIEDETGRLDFTSTINITLPDGRESGWKEISVNHPAGIGSYKVYQQTYGTKGSVTAERNGKSDRFWLEQKDFLSADGKNGIWFDALYPGFNVDEDGRTTLIESTSGHYENPVYVFTLMENDSAEMMMAFPGDSLEIGDMKLTFDVPTEYPGLRIKKSPAFANPALLAAVLVMTFGLYLSMFARPVLVSISDEGYTILGPHPEDTRIALERMMKKEGDTAV
ncbi:MAG: cytochrome c biogenesis protein ResB [Solobacterium sp.]|nr:cytochrome c biogenesis protein ResB [Solobacterium sp.]